MSDVWKVGQTKFLYSGSDQVLGSGNQWESLPRVRTGSEDKIPRDIFVLKSIHSLSGMSV